MEFYSVIFFLSVISEGFTYFINFFILYPEYLVRQDRENRYRGSG